MGVWGIYRRFTDGFAGHGHIPFRMKALLPLATSLVFAALPAFAAGSPPAPEVYASVEAKLTEALNGIRRDLIALGSAEKFPQLAGIEDKEVLRSSGDYTTHAFHHFKDADEIELFSYRYGKDGCRIELEFRSYDAKTDPRFVDAIVPARVMPHFQAESGGVPFGIRCNVEAEPTEAGKAFTKRVNELIEARVEDLKTELGAVAVTRDDLTKREGPLEVKELEKEAFIILEGVVSAHGGALDFETGKPERLMVKVTKVLGGGKNHFWEGARADDVIAVDTHVLKPALDLPVGATIKGYFKTAQSVNVAGEEGRSYYPVAPNGLEIIKPAPEK